MNWITNVVRPKINSFLRREMPENKWIRDPESGQMVYRRDLEANQFVMPGSGYHMRMSAKARLKALFDRGEYHNIEMSEAAFDPLHFRSEKKYSDKLKQARAKTGDNDAVTAAEGNLDGVLVVAAVQDFDFMGGSLGMAAGDAIITAMRRAVKLKSPFIFFIASGGARMQEGVFSLMQLPRTTIAVRELREARLPYIVVLTNPTTGGVSASYAMLGDIHIAEPGALIGFAGQRVIEQTIREKLPEGFQKSEYLLEHGMIDMVVHRHELRRTISQITHLLMRIPVAEKVTNEDSLPVSAEILEGSIGESKGTAITGQAIEAIPEPDGELKAAEMTAAKAPVKNRKRTGKKAARPALNKTGELADELLGKTDMEPSAT